MVLSSERWQRLESLFYEAIALSRVRSVSLMSQLSRMSRDDSQQSSAHSTCGVSSRGWNRVNSCASPQCGRYGLEKHRVTLRRFNGPSSFSSCRA